jgi:hypothetical protein
LIFPTMSKSTKFGKKTQGTLGVKPVDPIMCAVECFIWMTFIMSYLT